MVPLKTQVYIDLYMSTLVIALILVYINVINESWGIFSYISEDSTLSATALLLLILSFGVSSA